MPRQYRMTRKSTRRFGAYNVTLIVAGVLAALYAYSKGVYPILSFALALPFIGLALPPSLGTPTQRALVTVRALWHKPKGWTVFKSASFLKSSPKQYWDAFEFESIPTTEDGVTKHLCVVTTESHLTVYVRVAGNPKWPAADEDEKVDIDRQVQKALRAAGDETRQPLELAPIRMIRPRNPDQPNQYNRRRLRREMLAAAATGQGLPEDVRVARNAMVAQSMNVRQAATKTGVYAIRMPRQINRFTRKEIDLYDPVKFKQSHLFRTMRRLVIELSDAGIEGVSFMSRFEVKSMLSSSFRVSNASEQQIREERDRGLSEITKRPLDESNLAIDDPFPTSVEGQDGLPWVKPGILCYEGSYIAVGYLKGLREEFVPPGFLQRSLAVPRVWVIHSAYVEAVIVTSAKHAAWRKQKGELMLQDITTVDRRMVSPERDRRLAEARRQRVSLADSGTRAAEWVQNVSVVAGSVEEAEKAWETMLRGISRHYDCVRLWALDDMEQMFWGQFLLLDD